MSAPASANSWRRLGAAQDIVSAGAALAELAEALFIGGDDLPPKPPVTEALLIGKDDPPWPALGGVSPLSEGDSTAKCGEMLMVMLTMMLMVVGRPADPVRVAVLAWPALGWVSLWDDPLHEEL